MALDDLFTVIKADRYTADGCKNLNEALAKDKTYQTGQISEKTGLQKQPDGSWAPPKNGSGAGAKTDSSKPAEGKTDSKTEKLPKGVTKVIPISPEDKLDYGKSRYLNPNSDATKEADKIVNQWFESEGKEIMPDLYLVNEKGEAQAFSKRAGLVNKLAYMIENNKPYDLTYISRKDATAKDAAPLVLTGDTKIRVRK